MVLPAKKKDNDKKEADSQELNELWSQKSAAHGKKKELLAMQCELEAKINEATVKKPELAAKIKESAQRQAGIKEELSKAEKQEEGLRRETGSFDQKMVEIAKDLMALDRREKDKARELEEIRQRKSQVELERDNLLKKKDESGAKSDEFTKAEASLAEDMKNAAGIVSALKEELSDVEKKEDLAKNDMTDLEKEIDSITREIEDLDRKERQLIARMGAEGILPKVINEADKKQTIEEEKEKPPEEVPREVDSPFKEEELDDGRAWMEDNKTIKKDLEDLEKKTGERIEELRKAVRIIDGLINDLPMNAKKSFCSSRCYTEYKKMHDIVFNYKGEPAQKKFLRENMKWVLSEIDALLGKLKEEDIDRFLRSEDFKQYNKILEMYGIQQP